MNKRRRSIQDKYFRVSPSRSSRGPIVAAIVIGSLAVVVMVWFAFGDRVIESFRPIATLEKYHRIQNGMDKWEVIEIMGSPGDAATSMSFGTITSESLQWKNNEDSHLSVGFVGGRVAVKSQTGLK